MSKAEVVVLATPFQASRGVPAPPRAARAEKVLIDCTNPVGPGVTHRLGSKESGTEQIQALPPVTNVIEAFTIHGFENFERSAYPG